MNFYKIHHHQRAFSLIELLITLAIIGLLASIIYPSYNSYIVKIRRSNASVILLETASAMEQFYSKNNKYTGATLANLGIDDSGCKDYYQINISANTDTYSIEAIPIGTQAQNDTQCGTLGLTQDGKKIVAGSSGVNDCWGI